MYSIIIKKTCLTIVYLLKKHMLIKQIILTTFSGLFENSEQLVMSFLTALRNQIAGYALDKYDFFTRIFEI